MQNAVYIIFIIGRPSGNAHLNSELFEYFQLCRSTVELEVHVGVERPQNVHAVYAHEICH